MGKRTPSKWLTLMAACFGLLMLYIDLFIVIVPSFSVFSRLLSRVEQPAGGVPTFLPPKIPAKDSPR